MNIASKRLSLLLLLFSATSYGQFVVSPTINQNPGQPTQVPLIQTGAGVQRDIWGFNAGALFTPVTPSNGFGIIQPSFNYSWNFAGPDEQYDINIINSNPYAQYAIDDIFGCEVPQIGFNLDLGQAVDFNGCFERYRNGVQAAGDPVHLENELKACDCLRTSEVADVKTIMNLSLESNPQIELEARVKRVYQSGMDHVINGVAFQANVIAHGAPEDIRNTFVRDYTTNPFSYNPNAPKGLIRTGDKVTLNLEPTENPRLSRDDIINNAYPPILKANGDSTPVCISMVGFHRTRQIPSPKEWQQLDSFISNDFNKNDWDYNELQEDYERLMSKSSADRLAKVNEIAQIKAKLSFLNRNPLMKYFMGAEKEDYESVVKDGEVIGEGFKLKDKKAELFELVKSALNKPGCKSGEAAPACGEDLRRNLRNFFGDPNFSGIIGEIARSQMRKDIEARAKKASTTLNSTLPDSQLNMPALTSKFEREFNIQRPVDCRVSTDIRNVNETTDQCLMKMSAYCQFLKPYESRILKNSTASLPEAEGIADTLASELEDDFNTDPSTNEAFQQANQDFCHTQFPAKDGSPKATFFEFLNGYCADSSKEGCSKSTSADWDKLRKKYLELYNLESSKNSLDQGNHNIITEIAASTSGSGSSGGARGTGGAEGGEGSGGGLLDDEEFWTSGPVDPNCKKFCLGRRTSNVSSTDGGGQVATVEDPSKKPFFASMGEVVRDASGTTTTRTQGTQSPDVMFGGNYQTDYTVPSTDAISSQNIASKDVQEQILNQFQQKVDEVAANNPDSPEVRALQSDLAAIRAAFAQSQVANKSLTDKIAALERAQEILARNELTSPNPEQPRTAPSKGRTPASVPNPRVGLNELDRTISSVRENPTSAFANTGATLGGGPQRARVSGGAEFSSDAIRREEAKLINVESGIDGKLTITTNPRASGAAANGVSVEVPMTLYQTIQANPEGIDLSQIRISREQQSQVGDREFTLLVSSGDGNPPFKVQVQIKNNRLVRADSNNDGKPDRQVQTVRLENLNLIFRPIVQARN